MIRLDHDTLGIPATGLEVLRDLVHERTGIFYDANRTDMFAERLAPLVVRRGFRSFLDLYYLLKYDDAAALPAWREIFDALAVPETYFWREIDQIKAVVCRVIPELVRRARPRGPHLEHSVRERRGAADDRDGPRGVGLVRSRAD